MSLKVDPERALGRPLNQQRIQNAAPQVLPRRLLLDGQDTVRCEESGGFRVYIKFRQHRRLSPTQTGAAEMLPRFITQTDLA